MLEETRMLAHGVALAALLFRDKTDKVGQPYILHLLRVMHNCKTIGTKTLAVMHDLLEDTEIIAENLKKIGFSEDVVSRLVILTRQKDEKYENYIVRVAKDEMTREVKMRDLEDNMDYTRFELAGIKMTPDDMSRMAKYRRAYEYLLYGKW